MIHPLLTLTINPAVDLSTHTARLLPSHKLRCGPARVDPGGGGINVARVVARLGGRTLAVFPAGATSGERLQRLLHAEQVPCNPVPIEGETRESFSVLEEETGQEFRFVLPGPTLSEREWQHCLDRTVALAEGCRFVVASGSLPPGVPEDFYGRLAGRLGGTGARLVLDSSGAALAAGLEAGVYLCKPSLRELRELTGEPLPDLASRRAACRALVAAGRCEMVALSLGAEGAMLVTADAAWHAAAVPVKVASTIGAGDTFLGALLWALARGDDAEEAFAQAMAASAAALLETGTALCRPEDVRRLREQVTVHPA